MEIIFVLFIIFIVIAFFLKNAATNNTPKKTVNVGIAHDKKEYLTTENERKLFFALRKALDEKYLIHCQTSLIALVDPVEYKYKSKAWSRRMDYVITDTATKVICVIELDDSTHKQQKRIERDLYVNDALKGRHTLIRLETQKFYKPEELAELFDERLNIKNFFKNVES